MKRKAEWTGHRAGATRMIAGMAMFLALALLGAGTCTAAETDKTFVVWTSVLDLEIGGGSVLTLQRGVAFDAIVLGEMEEGKWMVGSDNFNRTQAEQNYPRDTEENELVQLAVVYKDNTISLYRNGELLSAYDAENIDLISGDDQAVVFGLRHLIGGDGRFEGAIDDARIYAKALSVAEIKSLKPNQASEIEPWAWWDFEGENVEDRTGRFTHARNAGSVWVKDGLLWLIDGGTVIVTRNEKTMDWAIMGHPVMVSRDEYVAETPTMPEEIPENWLTYHLAHPGPDRAEPGDPNPAFYYNGRYHLHYIYASKYGYAFAHVSSTDMVHWEWQPTVLAPPITGHGMFSGTGFFTKEGEPAAIYHGEGSGRNWIIYGQDDTLDTWSEPEKIVAYNPDGEEAEINYWDPDSWLRGDTYYALSGGRPPLLMKSDDLKKWDYLGELFHEDTDWEKLGVDRNEDVSCANMFKIGDKWMLLCISHQLGARYYLGDFKDDKYLPESHHLMNWKEVEYFAPESLVAADERRVMWAWVTGDLPLSSSQTGVQALPRELSLPEDGVLRIKPLRELKSLRYDEQDEGELEVAAGERYRLKKIAGNTVELSVVIQPTDAKSFGARVFCDDEGNGMPIRYLADEKKLAVGDVKAPFELKDGEALHLSIFLDKDMVEVFANDRQAIATGQENGYKNTAIELFSEGGAIQASVTGWQMRSIYSGE